MKAQTNNSPIVGKGMTRSYEDGSKYAFEVLRVTKKGDMITVLGYKRDYYYDQLHSERFRVTLRFDGKNWYSTVDNKNCIWDNIEFGKKEVVCNLMKINKSLN